MRKQKINFYMLFSLLMSSQLYSQYDYDNKDTARMIINTDENYDNKQDVSSDNSNNIQDVIVSHDDQNKKYIYIELNNYKFLSLLSPAKDVFISNPDIMDIKLHSSTSFSLIGLKMGETNLLIRDKFDNNMLSAKIVVTHNFSAIKKIIKKMHPEINISLEQIVDGILITGSVPSPEIAASVQEVVGKFVGGNANVINKLNINTSTQVLLKVKIAEVSRDVTKDFGINWRAISEISGKVGYNIGLLAGTGGNVPPVYAKTDVPAGGNTDNTAADTFKSKNFKGDDLKAPDGANWIVNWVNTEKGLDMGGIIDALAKEGLAVILAEPTLTAISGKTAVFKSGGEAGYTVTGASLGGAATTEFKEWGTSLSFTPTVMSEDRILITVNPKVSTLNSSGGKDQAPALTVKEVQTTVELGSGQSLAIAGLLQKSVSSNRSDVPFLADIPLFGNLFRSSYVTKEEKELVIIVTAYIVKPSSKTLSTPIDMIPKLLAPTQQIFKNSFTKNISYDEIQSITTNTGYTIS